MATESEILTQFRQRALGTGELLSNIKNISKKSSVKISTFWLDVLKESALYLVETKDKLFVSHSTELFEILDVTCKCLGNVSDSQTQCCLKERSLYHILSNLVRLNHLKQAFVVSSYTCHQMEAKLAAFSTEIPPVLDCTIRNCYLLFWNHAADQLKRQQLPPEMIEQALQSFYEALNYLKIFEQNLDDVIIRATKVIQTFEVHLKGCFFEGIKLYKNINQLILNTIKSDRIKENNVINTLILFHKWNVTFGSILEKQHSSQAATDVYLQCEIFAAKMLPTKHDDANSIPFKVCSKCIQLLSHGLKMCKDIAFVDCEKLLNNISSLDLYLTNNITNGFAVKNNAAFQFAISVTKLLQICIIKSDLEKTLTTTEWMKLLPNVEKLYFLYLHVLSVERNLDFSLRENTMEANYSAAFMSLQNLFHLFMKFLEVTECDASLATVFPHAHEVGQKINNILEEAGTFIAKDHLQNLGLMFGNVGIIYYKNGLYSNAIPFLRESCSFLNRWCWQDNVIDDVKKRMSKVNMENKYLLLLVSSLRKTESYDECLKVLAYAFSCYPQTSGFLDYWVVVKQEAKFKGIDISEYRTIRQVLQNTKHFRSANVFELLQFELNAFKSQKVNNLLDQYEIVKDMLDEAKEPLQHGIALIELAQVQWNKSIEDEKSALLCCEEAIAILKQHLIKTEDRGAIMNIKYQLGIAHYWHYLAQLQISQDIFQNEMKEPILTIEQKIFPLGEEDENVDASWDCVPVYAHMTLDKEIESLHSLNEAVSVWDEVISEHYASDVCADQTILDLQAAAEIYKLAKQEFREIEAWKLSRKLAELKGRNSDYVLTTAKLIQAYCNMRNFLPVVNLLESAASFLPKLHCENTEEAFAVLRYHIAASEYALYKKDMVKCAKILQQIWCHPFLQKKSRFSRIVSADVRLLSSRFVYSLRNVNEISKELDQPLPWENLNAIELAVMGFHYYLGLAKLLVKDSKLEDKDLSPTFSHCIVGALMDASLRIGQMYIDIGAPREARCYLGEQLTTGKRLGLGFRTSAFLLALAKVDLLCEESNNCRIKLNRIQSLLLSENNSSQEPPKIADNLLSKADYSFVEKLGVKFPEFLSHSSKCSCVKCLIPAVTILSLEMLIVYAEYLAFRNSHDAAEKLLKLVLSLLVAKLSGRKITSRRSEYLLAYIRLQLSNFLRQKENYQDALVLVHVGIQQLNNCSYLCHNHERLMPRLLYQKGICMLHIIAKQYQTTPLEFLQQMLAKKNVKVNQHLALEMQKLNVNSLCETATKRKKQNYAITTTPLLSKREFVEGIDCLGAEINIPVDATIQQLCQAPKKKVNNSKFRVLETVFEPSDSSDSDESKAQNEFNKRGKTKSRSRVAMRQTVITYNLADSENLSSEGKDPIPLSQSKSLPQKMTQKMMYQGAKDEVESVLQVLNSETPGQTHNDCVKEKKAVLRKGSTTRSRTKNGKENGSSSANKNPLFSVFADNRDDASDLVFTENNSVRRSRRMVNKLENVEKSRGDNNEPDLLLLNDSSFILSELDEITEEEVLPEKIVSPVEIFRTGEHKKKTRSESRKKSENKSMMEFEEMEIFRESDGFGNGDDFCLDSDFHQQLQSELNVETISQCLEEAFDLISHHPLCPLYADLCLLLVLFKTNDCHLAGFYLSESSFVTLRHQGVINLGKKISKLKQQKIAVTDDNEQQNEIINDSLLSALKQYQETLNFSYLSEQGKTEVLDLHLNSLPEDWVVCQISMIPPSLHKSSKNCNQPLVLGRYQRNKKAFVKFLPSDDDVPCTLLDELNNILAGSKLTMKEENKRIWWESRRTLDARLKDVTNDLENVWLGHWKGLFKGKPVSENDQQNLTKAAREVLSVHSCCEDSMLIEMLLTAVPFMSTKQLHSAIAELFELGAGTTKLLELSNIIQEQATIINAKEIVCHPVILILGKGLELLPWESMPIFSGQSVSRMSSLSLLHGHLSWQCNQCESVYLQGVDKRKTYYILNPGNDLPSTQERFQEWFATNENWNGVIGRPPTEAEFSQGLNLHDLFVYCGHGSGSKYLSGDAIQRLFCRAVTLLMGCSSGKLRVFGHKLEPGGHILQYLLAGCPCVVGALWDVTDRDIDRYLQYLLTHWKVPKIKLLTNVISPARLACRLPYLIGSATVVYGLPVAINA